MTQVIKSLLLIGGPVIALAACALPASQQASVKPPPPIQTYVAGPASTNAGTPPYAQLVPFENSMGVVQSRNSLPPGAE